LLAIQVDRTGHIPNSPRAQRLLESEVHNRPIRRPAPVGLGLLSAQDGSVLLPHTAMRELSARPSDAPLPSRRGEASRPAG
ncbi:hypothetical protein AAHH79_38485, partial [Burkholderia pseudomallei]